MGAVRLALILVVAAVVAVAVALLARGFTGPRKAQAHDAPVVREVEKPTAQVLVAKHDLPVGTRLASGDLGWQSWPLDGLNPLFITDGAAPAVAPTTAAGKAAEQAKQTVTAVTGGGQRMEALYGSIVREAILANEPILQQKLVRAGESNYMAVVLEPGMRAVSVAITADKAAGGFILPGDHVDVVQNHDVDGPNGNKRTVTDPILRNVRVLAIDQKTQPDKGATAMVGATATLETTTEAAEALLRAQGSGTLQLVLRSYADTGGATSMTAAVAPKGPDNVVRIYRSGQMSEVVARQ